MTTDLESLSPFELSLYLEKKVRSIDHPKEWLNAGRGNPNWTAFVPHEAYFLLGQFATEMTMRHSTAFTAGMVDTEEIYGESLLRFLDEHPGKGSAFLRDIWENGTHFLGMAREKWLAHMMDYIIGDNYPNPERVLKACELPIKQYLHHELFDSDSAPFDVFAVEGGTAAICYVFDSLVNNGLLHPKDKIALMIPTFAPYLEIPELPQYEFDVEYIKAQPVRIDGQLSHQYPDEELNRLRNKDIKALFVVNPSNPTSDALSEATIALLQEIIREDNPNLMILTDDVYGTFLPKFTSLFTAIPYNTACIYSYSKYFGATGWRIGTIAVAKDNLFDRLLSEHSRRDKKALNERYGTLASEPEKIKFIDRMVADSRDIALNHAAGLSSPQQVMMVLFSLYSLLDKEHGYKKEVMAICHERETLLFDHLGLEHPLPSLSTAYYCEIDLQDWMADRYGASFAAHVREEWTVTDFLTRLAEEEHLMLLKTDAFGSGEWTVRVSLANLATEHYAEVGSRIVTLTDCIHQEYQSEFPSSRHQ